MKTMTIGICFEIELNQLIADLQKSEILMTTDPANCLFKNCPIRFQRSEMDFDPELLPFFEEEAGNNLEEINAIKQCQSILVLQVSLTNALALQNLTNSINLLIGHGAKGVYIEQCGQGICPTLWSEMLEDSIVSPFIKVLEKRNQLGTIGMAYLNLPDLLISYNGDGMIEKNILLNLATDMQASDAIKLGQIVQDEESGMTFKIAKSDKGLFSKTDEFYNPKGYWLVYENKA